MTLTKWKLTMLALIAGLALAGGGLVSYRTLAGEAGPPAADEGAAARVARLKERIAALQDELRQAEQDEAREREAAVPSPVAVVFGDVPITRAELGDYLIRRLSREQLQAYVNRRIVEHACRRKGVVVTEREVDRALELDRLATRADGRSFEDVLHEQHRTLLEWKEDVLRPRLLLGELCADRVRVTEQDLRDAYEASYGEKVECAVIFWPRQDKEKALRAAGAVGANPATFERFADSQPMASLAAAHGRTPPFGRHSSENADLERAAFRLRPGETSDLLDTPDGFFLVKCLRRLPADTSRSFAEVRDGLEQEVRERRLEKEIPRAFKELRQEARPRLLWQPTAP
jgi:parvulin-like peptidyl-prolyl isomerase